MKKIKNVAFMLVTVMTLGLLGGCGNSFDASAYTKALLDNSYKNDSTAFVAEKVGTAEEASELYEEGIDTEVDSLLAGVELSDELEAEFREVIKDIFARVRYTVGDAEKQDDGSYVVTITYEQMQVFTPAMEAYLEGATALTEEWMAAAYDGGEIPSDAEMYEQIYSLLKDCLTDSLASVTYAEEATTTMRIEIVDNVYTPNENDIYELETLLFDVDSAANVY